MAFSPDGRQLAYTVGKPSADGRTIQIIEVATGKETVNLKSPGGLVAFSPDGKYIASAGNKEFKMWDATTGHETVSIEVPGVSAISPDGRLIACIQDFPRGDIILRDLSSGHEIMTLTGHNRFVRTIAFSPDGKRLASGSDDLTIKLWDITTGQETLTLNGHRNWITCLAFSPDGNRLASSSNDGTLRLWDARPLAEKDASLPASQGNIRENAIALPSPSVLGTPTQK